MVHVREPAAGAIRAAPTSSRPRGRRASTATPPTAIAGLVRRGRPATPSPSGCAVACGSRPARGLGHVAEALLNGRRGAAAAGPAGHAPARPACGASSSRSRAARRRRPPCARPTTPSARAAARSSCCTWSPATTPAEPGSLPAPRIVDQEHYEWSAWQDEFRMRFSQCPEGGRHRVCVRVGEPAPDRSPRRRSDVRRRADRPLLERELRRGHGAVVQRAARHGAVPAAARAHADAPDAAWPVSAARAARGATWPAPPLASAAGRAAPPTARPASCRTRG